MRTIKREIVSALIFSSDNKLLMVKKDHIAGGVYVDCWHLPGGGIEEGETKEQALTREIIEEVGIDISQYEKELMDDKGRGESKKTLRDTNEKVLAKMHFNVYKIVIKDKPNDKISVKLNDELENFEWFDLNDLKTAKLTPPSVTLFKKIGFLDKTKMENEIISNKPLDDLGIFLEHVDSLQKSSFLKFIVAKPKISFTIGYTEGKGTNYTESWPKEEDIKSFIVDFCQIYLTKKQPANFLHICNLLEKSLKDEESKKSMRSYRKIYNEILNKNKLIGIHEDGKEKRPDRILEEWIMGYYRHDDKEYRSNIQRWELLGGGMYKFMFINVLINLLNPIFGITRIIKSDQNLFEDK